MEKLNELAVAQEQLGKEFTRMLSNMKKDSPTVKNEQYFERRSNSSKKCWEEVQDNHKRILELNISQHSYFDTNYFEQIQKCYQDVEKYIQENNLILLKPAPSERVKQRAISPAKQAYSSQHEIRERKMNEIKASLRRIEVQLKENQPTILYQAIQNKIIKQWNEVEDFNSQLRAQGIIEYDEEAMELAERYEMILVQLTSKINNFDHQNQHASASPARRTNLSLPEIKIPFFDGRYEDWPTFHDIFSKIVDLNDSLNKTEKMQYLKTHVRGEASRAIQHFQITENNYEAAMEILKKRYSNNRLLVSKLLDKILDFPAVSQASAQKIKQLHDTTVECLKAVDNMEIRTAEWGPLVIRIITRKWDDETNKLYEQALKNPHEVQDFQEFMAFLQMRYQSLEAMTVPNKRAIMEHRFQPIRESCTYCRGPHQIQGCAKFRELTPDNRFNAIRERNLCPVCMKHDKNARCTSTYRCNKCNNAHHSMLHREWNNNRIQRTGTRHQSSTNRPERTTATSAHIGQGSQTVLLATALVQARTVCGSTEYLRALIDPGSQAAFITDEAATRLALPRQKIRAEVSGLGAGEPKVSNWKVETQVSPRFPSDFKLEISCLILPKLTKTMPEQRLEVKNDEWNNLMLADPTFQQPGPIDVIIGAKEYSKIVLQGIYKSKDGLLGQNTELGWTLSGDATIQRKETINLVSMISAIDKDDQLTKFWELEEVASARQWTDEEKQCEEHYIKNTTRSHDGKYMVKIPFREDSNELGNSKNRAAARLIQLEKRLAKNSELELNYKKFMAEYLELGHMIPVPERQLETGKYYIPHQPVVKEERSTTKLRVVFDASCKTSNGRSLNETMHVGPRLQQELADIVLRWRLHKVVITADIEKMYRQIKIHPDEQMYQRILWRFDERTPIQEYQLTTVTYGMSAAPFLAIRTLQKLAEDSQEKYPNAAEVAKRDFYVDDLLSGTDSKEEASQLQTELCEMLESGGFRIRKWSTNHPEVLQHVPQELRNQATLELSADETIKSLGIHWAPHNDEFRFKVETQEGDTPTKRAVLSGIAKLFDPLGWLAPVIIKAKIFMQTLWLQELSWDDALPEQAQTEWVRFRDQLKSLESITIPRWIQHEKDSRVELHGFCDASERAYGAVIYARTIKPGEEARITLITAKSKVNPIKAKQTIPRLELCSALLLAKLMSRTRAAFHIDNVSIHAWTDSMIALCWIKGDTSRWKSFVANRVTEIQQHIPPKEWQHVKSEDNPADAISRGVDPPKLKEHRLWWTGPTWLSLGKHHSKIEIGTTDEEAKQTHKKLCFQASIQTENQLIQRFSSLLRLTRVTAYCYRFINRCKGKANPQKHLTTQELEAALQKTIKIVQHQLFEKEIARLHEGRPVDKKSKIATLNPFLDDDSILRVGGRLQHSPRTYNEKHPMILPYSHHITNLIIRDAHSQTLHGGTQATLAYTRRKVWIINGKRAVRVTINHCVKCLRYKAQHAQPIMGDLPQARVTPAPPFFHTGVDYAGPLQIRATKGRGHKAYKGYIAVFVCFTTKAVHLEVVSDMTSDMFLAAFRRFISRRGRCGHLYSDNGTNFVGAKAKLDKEIQTAMAEANTAERIESLGTQWHFIPPAAPHFGGLWEAAVKSMKHHLKRIMGNATLTYEELTTLIHQIEACLNSRPLGALSENPEDVMALTPGHFLIGREIVTPPDPITTDIATSLSGRWRLIQKLKKDFWKSWSTEYLNQLQQRYKWKTKQRNLRVGELVLIKEDNINPSNWPIARIREVHPGTDGAIRVATLRKKGEVTTKRPVHKLIPLMNEEIERDEESFRDKPKQGTTNKRKPYKKLWRLVLMALFFISAAKKTNAVQYSIHYPEPGLYIEHIGTTRIDRGTFRIDAKINWKGIQEATAALNETVLGVQNLCTQACELSEDIQCATLIHHLKEKENQIHWLQRGMEENVRTRRKRGILGRILTAVFGINDEVYQDIEALDRNQHELIKASSHQTKIMVQSVSSFNDTENRIDSQLNHFREKLNKGITSINTMQKWYKAINVNKIEIHLLGTYQIALSYMNEVLEYYKKIADIQYNHGHIHELITPAHIEELLKTASEKLPTNLMILNHPIQKTAVKHDNEYLHIFSYFMITEITEFLIIKATPVPIQIGTDHYWSLDVPNGVLAIDYDNQKYFQLSEDEFRNAVNIGNNVFICSPIATRNIETSPNCIIDEIYQRAENTTCPTQKNALKTPIWKQLDTPNHWMFISPDKIKVAITCNGKREEVFLNKTGIIGISQNCVVKTKQIVLTPKQVDNIPVIAGFLKPIKINISTIAMHGQQPIEQEPVIKAAGNLRSIRDEEEAIQTELHENTWKSIKQYTTISSSVAVSTGLIIAIILMGIFKAVHHWRRQIKTRKHRPANNTDNTHIASVELQPLAQDNYSEIPGRDPQQGIQGIA